MLLVFEKYWNSMHMVKYKSLTVNMIELDLNIFLHGWFDTSSNTVLTLHKHHMFAG